MGTDTAECTVRSGVCIVSKEYGCNHSLHKDVKAGSNIFSIPRSSQCVFCL
ncbi:hypothetical protein T09_11823 [Trichinella sp. T9]|nr:hypothetical protein T09_11823 [Trichinella sp. T9]